MSSTISVHLSGRSEESIDELRGFVRFCSLPIFDRWNNVVQLDFDEMNITWDFYSLLLDFFELPLAKDPTGSSDEERRWIDMTMENTHFSCSEGDYMVRHRAQRLCSVIADRALRLKITRSEQVLALFLDAPEIEHLSVETLHIHEGESLSAQQYARLGNMIARSVQVRDLYLRLPVDDGAQELYESLANATNLQKVSLHDGYSPENTLAQAQLLIGSNGPLIRHLQNPFNQLKELRLSKLGLNDQHLITVSQLLPICQIEVFDVSDNLIELDGILEFARQLSRIHHLKHVRLGLNPWEKSEIACKTFGAALLQGIMENTSLESMDRAGLTAIPQGLLVWHYLVLNRVGRRLLASSQPIPDGLWPLVLERAGDVKRYKSIEMSVDLSSDEMSDDSRIDTKGIASYNAVYFFWDRFVP